MPDTPEATETLETTETPETTEAAPVETTEPVETTDAPAEETPETTEAPEEPAYVAEMREQITALQDQLKARAGAVDKPAQPAAPQPLREEDWVNIEKEFGFVRTKGGDGAESIAVNPRALMTAISSRLANVFEMAKKYADDQVHGNVSDIRFNSVLEDLSRKTPDVKNFSKAIGDYLKSRYHAKDRSNPEYIMDGYWWAKGKGLSNTPKPAGGQPPVKRKIVQPARAGGNNKPAGGKVALTAFERQQIEQGFFKDEAELIAYKKKNLNV